MRPTMFVASLDIKKAFDDARPEHVAGMMQKQNMHGWLTSALLREMSQLQGRATLEGVGTSIDATNKGV